MKLFRRSNKLVSLLFQPHKLALLISKGISLLLCKMSFTDPSMEQNVIHRANHPTTLYRTFNPLFCVTIKTASYWYIHNLMKKYFSNLKGYNNICQILITRQNPASRWDRWACIFVYILKWLLLLIFACSVSTMVFQCIRCSRCICRIY